MKLEMMLGLVKLLMSYRKGTCMNCTVLLVDCLPFLLLVAAATAASSMRMAVSLSGDNDATTFAFTSTGLLFMPFWFFPFALGVDSLGESLGGGSK